MSRKPTCLRCRAEYELPYSVLFRGERVVSERAEMCPACAERYLAEHAGTCGVCKGPILPGSPVAVNHDASPQEFVHYTLECSVVGSYVGVWGEGGEIV
jgi:hypothetical protein